MFVCLQNKPVCVESTSAKSLYKHLIEIKYKRPMIKRNGVKNFDISEDVINWRSIYNSRQICNIKVRNLEQFHYKLLHNILSSSYKFPINRNKILTIVNFAIIMKILNIFYIIVLEYYKFGNIIWKNLGLIFYESM